MRHSIRLQSNTNPPPSQTPVSMLFERFTAGLMDRTGSASFGCTAWPARESPQLPAPSLANTLRSVLERASSFQEVAEMLAMPASSLRLSPCSLQRTYRLLSGTFCEAILDDNIIASQDLRDQWRHIVLAPLSKLPDNSCPSSYLLVVDALDECDDDKNIRIILQLLAEARSLKTVRLRIFMTSRPEFAIRQSVYRLPETELRDFALRNIAPATVDQDISLFFTYD